MYDPLIDKSLGNNAPYPNSYWADVAGNPPVDDGQLNKDINVYPLPFKVQDFSGN